MHQIFVQKLFIYFLECVAKNLFRVLFIYYIYYLLYYIYYLSEIFAEFFFAKKSEFWRNFFHFWETNPCFRNLEQNKCTTSCNNCFAASLYIILARIYSIHVFTILATLQPIFCTKPFICRFSAFLFVMYGNIPQRL